MLQERKKPSLHVEAEASQVPAPRAVGASSEHCLELQGASQQEGNPTFESGEELRLAQEALKESRDRYLDLYEFAPVAYLTLDEHGLIEQINLTGAVLLLDGEREQILDHPFGDFIVPRDRDRWERMLTQAAGPGERFAGPFELQRGDGSTLHAQVDCVYVTEGRNRPALRIAVTDLTERKHAEQEIESLAFYDPLTRLPNRRLLLDRLQHATSTSARSGNLGAVLFMDLDNFKTLNDTQGHHAGDQVLQQAAERLTTCVRASDTVARLGGDEFIVMLENLSRNDQEAAAQVRVIGEKILAALKKDYLFLGQDYRSTASIGATLFSRERHSVEELLRQADLALYRAKAAGGDMLRFFEPEMQAAMAARAELEADLRRALRQDEFFLVFQPQVGRDGCLVGAEALLRWKHPRRGVLAPAEFIQIAEKRGLITALDQWALEAACRQLVCWSERASTAALRLSVNLSAYAFRHPELVTRTIEIIERVGADPARLTIEITESHGRTAETAAKMHALREHGLQFALDDFGMGYSSLACVRNMPVSQLKIDRSFIRHIPANATDGAIATSILTLGKSLGLEVIAEGVETEEQRAFLASRGCTAYQGHLYGKPGPAADLRRLMRRPAS